MVKKTGLSGSLSGDCLSDLYLRGSHSSMVSAFYEYRIDNAHRHYHGFISRYSVSHSRRSDRCCFWPCSWRGRNVDSSVSASILMFLFIRYGYQEWGERVLHRHNSLGKITVLFEKKCVCDDPVYPVDSFYTLDHCKCLFGFKPCIVCRLCYSFVIRQNTVHAVICMDWRQLDDGARKYRSHDCGV